MPPSLPDRAELARLAARDDVESRLVTVVDGRWSMRAGPFDRLPRRRRDWTLLVQGVNLYDARADALMRRFDFVSAMRLDDLMISHAVDGGGVGPHLDSYDVFLLQVEGRRRWRWRRRVSRTKVERELVEGAPVKLLKNFVPTDEAVLEPGDLLYLPPSCAHEGVAIGDSTTASIGFRAPAWNELTQEFLFAQAERAWPDGHHADPGRRATTTPAAIDGDLLAAVERKLAAVRWTARDVEAFVGMHFSTPKANVWFDTPTVDLSPRAFARRAARGGLRLDARTTLLYRGPRGYIAGEPFAFPAASRVALRALADRRVVDRTVAATLVADPATRSLLHRWWCDGWIHFVEGEVDGTS